MMYYLTITPRDPIVARDGRPFGAGQGHRMRSLDWLYPSVLAGSLRTLVGKLAGIEFTADLIKDLKQLEVAGPLPMTNGELYFPAPKDFLVWNDEEEQDLTKKRKLLPLRPIQLNPNERVCDLPNGLSPMHVAQDVKPVSAAAFWSKARMCSWLINPSAEGFSVPPEPREASSGSGYLDIPKKDERIHVKIDPQVGAAEESLLFMTVGLDFSTMPAPACVTLAARVDGAYAFGEKIRFLNTLHPLGGERRLLHWRAEPTTAWEGPEQLSGVLRNAQRVRLILATSALFGDGWKPAWLNDNLEGCPPGTDVRLRLISACVERWKPLSGWSLETGQTGPKPIRRLVPAGSVYFFVVISGDATMLVEKLWLRSVCDEDQDRRDGFGLALWGVWDYSRQNAGGK